MSYTVLAGLAVAVALVLDLWVLRVRLLRRRAFWTAYGIVLLFQLIVDGVLTGREVVRYAPEAILGPRLAFAPIEDLAFGFALVLVTLSTWVALGRRSGYRAR